MTQQHTRYVVAAIVVAALLLMIALTGDGDLGGSPRDRRGMTAAMATLYGAIIAGTFTVLGVVVERLIQRYGKVRCEMEPIRLWIIATREDDLTVRTLPLPDVLDEEVAKQNRSYEDEVIRCLIDAKLFNEKDVKIGIRDVVVVFEGRGVSVEQKMLDRSTWRSSSATGQRQMDYLEDVNLPSREWIHLSLLGEIGLEDARKLTRCDKAWLRGYYPDGRLFSERVPTQGAAQ